MFPSNTPLKVPTEPARANVLGVGVHAVDLPSAVDLLEASISRGQKGYVCVTSVHGIMQAKRDAEFRRILDHALLVTPDGMPTVWVGRMQKHHRMRRVFGPDLMSEVCTRSPNKEITHFLYGGKPGVADELRRKLEARFPSIRVVGTFTPPFRPLIPEEQDVLEKRLAKLRPDIVWVGLSTPKQEHFMASMIDRLCCKLMIGVGAAFDVHTGRVKDAPEWVKKLGLQWFHRLCQEPSRLWKRYLMNNSAFLWHLALQASGVRRYELSQ